MKKYLFLFFILALVSSCKKDKPESPPPVVQATSTSKKVFVINEGNYGTGNSSVSLYDPGTGQVVEDYYQATNKTQLGDVTQSLTRINGNYYIVVNNSGKIVICNQSFAKIGQINGMGSPRYILPVSNQKAYVSDLYANAISIIDLNTNTKTGKINCKGKPEKMQILFNKVFVTNTDSRYLYIIDPTKDRLEDSVYVGLWASSLVVDRFDKLWVLAGGNSPDEAGRLSRIDPIGKTIEFFFEFPKSQFPSNLCINRGKDSLYFLNAGVFRYCINDSGFPAAAFINPGSRNFYGLDVSPNDYSIYVSDALLYTERSNIYVYDVNGGQKQLFKAGVNANGFYFE